MKKLFKWFMPLVLLSFLSDYAIACQNPESSSYIDNNLFTEIPGVQGVINNVTFHINSEDNIVFYASDIEDKKIYQTDDNQKFQSLDLQDIDENSDFRNIIVDSQNNLYLATQINDSEDEIESLIYKYDQTAKTFKEIKEDFFKDKKIMEIFLDKKDNIYVATEEDDSMIIYQFPSNESENNNEPKEIKRIADQILQDLIVDNNGNIYITTEDFDDKSYFYKINIKDSQLNEIFSLEIEKFSFMASNSDNDYIYVVTKNDNTQKDNIYYYSPKEEQFEKTDIQINWRINKIIIDDQNHIFVGGTNNNIFAGTLNKNKISNFNVISKQMFNFIYSLDYKENILVVGSKNKFYFSKIDNFRFS